MKSLILGIIGSILNFAVYGLCNFIANWFGPNNALGDVAAFLSTAYLIIGVLNIVFAILSIKWKGASGFLTLVAILDLLSGAGFLSAIFNFIAASACKNRFAKMKQKELEEKVAALEAAQAKNNE